MGHEIPSRGYLKGVVPSFFKRSKSIEKLRDADGEITCRDEDGQAGALSRYWGGTITTWASTKSLDTLSLTDFVSGTV